MFSSALGEVQTAKSAHIKRGQLTAGSKQLEMMMLSDDTLAGWPASTELDTDSASMEKTDRRSNLYCGF